MKKVQYPAVYIGLYCMLLISAAAATSVNSSSPFIGMSFIFLAALYGISMFCGWQYNKLGNNAFKYLTNAFAIVSVLSFLVVYPFLGLEKALIIFLIILQAAQNFSFAARRVLYYSYIVSLILILYAASVGKQTYFLFYIVLYVLAGVFTLMADYIDERLRRASGGDRDVLVNKMNLPVKGVGLSAAILITAIILYSFIPRPPSPHIKAFPTGGQWYYTDDRIEREVMRPEYQGKDKRVSFLMRNAGYETGDESDYNGFRKEFDITDRGGCGLSNEILFYLQTSQPTYARGRVFDTFDGKTWTHSKGGGRRKFGEKGVFVFDRGFKDIGIGQIYMIEKNLPELILTAYRPIALYFASEMIEIDDDMAMKAPTFLRKGTKYSVLSYIQDDEHADTAYDGGNIEDIDQKRYLQVPWNISRRMRDLPHRIAKRLTTDQEKAEVIETFLNSNYIYTTETMFYENSSEVLDEFLFETGEGHCEFFASSMVIMLRLLDIPARLVTGYRATEYNPFTGYYEVRKFDAHAWVEAYIKGRGWMTFEPTSTFVKPEPERRNLAVITSIDDLSQQIRKVIRSNPESWWAKILQMIGNIIQETYQFMLSILFALKSFIKLLSDWFLASGWIVIGSLLCISGAVWVALPLIRKPFLKWRLKRIKAGEQRETVIRCYESLEKLCCLEGVPRHPHITVKEYDAMLRKHFVHLSDQIQVITGMFHLAKYSPHAVSEKDVQAALNAYDHILRFQKL